MRNKAILSAILEAAADAIIVADANGIILRANPAAGRLFQFDPEDLTGRKVNVLMPDAHAHQHDGFMAHHIHTGERRIIGRGRDVEGKRHDGSIFPLHLSVGRADLEGAPVFVGILHDLSIRKAAEDALGRAQRLDALGHLTGGIAHDFNNILTVVIGNLELLENRGLTLRQAPLVKDALTSAELGADLTDRLKVFARRSNLQPVKTDLAASCKDALVILRRTLGSNFAIKTDFPDDLASVMIDPVLLQSALMNLVINARDAMGDRGRVLLSAGNVTVDDAFMVEEMGLERGEYVRLSVSDNGAGMHPDVQKRAFEPFFTTKSTSGGSGLGLAMVYGFVKQSGGHITLYSEPGEGTSFGLYFPVAGTDAGAPRTHPVFNAPTQDTADVPRGSGQTILVVEDNPRVRKLSMERLRALGYEPRPATTGEEAWRLLSQGLRVDAVFTDLVMPGALNGYELAAKLHTAFPDLPVVMTSGYASDVVSNSIPDHPPDDILHKPYRLAELAARLHAVLPGPSDRETT